MRIFQTSLALLNGQILPIGKQGEHRARQIVIDARAWKEKWPSYTVTAALKPIGSDQAQETRVHWEGDQIVWPITAQETAESGGGAFELCLRDEQGSIIKSATAGYRVVPSPTENGVEPLPSGGDAETAERLLTPRKIQLTGDAAGETLFDGSQDVELAVTVTGGKVDLSAMTENEVEEILNE